MDARGALLSLGGRFLLTFSSALGNIPFALWLAVSRWLILVRFWRKRLGKRRMVVGHRFRNGERFLIDCGAMIMSPFAQLAFRSDDPARLARYNRKDAFRS